MTTVVVTAEAASNASPTKKSSPLVSLELASAPPPSSSSPDDRKKLRRRSLPPNATDERATKRRATHRLCFQTADIVEFEPTAYTTTVTSGGVPLGMSLKERSRSRRRLDSWEQERAKTRIHRQQYMEEGYIDPIERETILKSAGCPQPVVDRIETEVHRIIEGRRISNEIDADELGIIGCAEEEEEVEEVEIEPVITSESETESEREPEVENDNSADEDYEDESDG